ncbi:quinoprotein dehydrogenase-associated SoxYZ-like carrier [Nevskia sp.]|uniref:quinoprotein dehydrogenase-associated SoxYZ-like carrier n=1 Tax=Nevskia sp. TaxID=1929292 RepID=UPI003F6FA8F5
MTKPLLQVLAWLGLVAGGPVLAAAELPADPLNSPAWSTIAGRYFKGQPVVFDARVKVTAPASAEDPLDVPVQISADGLADVQEMLVVADLNPIQKILSYEPLRAQPSLAFRFKVEQSTPIRVAARTRDGVWHLGGVWLSAAGGGCTTPSYGSADPVWQTRLNEVRGRLWPAEDHSGQRLRLRVIHPMDTGLANGIPAFYIDRIVLSDAKGVTLARLNTFEPIAENPVLSFDLKCSGAVQVSGGDIQGNRFSAEITP